MTIEIRELIVRAQVGPAGTAAPNAFDSSLAL